MPTYTTYENSNGTTMIMRTDEDGTIYCIPPVAENSDYQTYLAYLASQENN